MVANSRASFFWSVLLLLPLLVVELSAQSGTTDRSKGTMAFEVEGIQVIMTPADNELVSVVVGLDGGVADGMISNPALADITADLVASSGSIATSKKKLREFLTMSSTRLSGSADRIGVNFSMTSTLARFEQAWPIFAGIVRAPLFDTIEFRNIVQRRIATVRNAFSNPQRQANRIADSLMRYDHPWLGRYTYENDVEGVTLDDVRAFYTSLAERSRMLVVIVGNVTELQVRKMLSSFTTWPAGSYTRPSVERLVDRTSPTLVVAPRPEIPTNYVYAMFNGPSTHEPESWPMTIGMSYFRAILFREIRTERNLSYAPSAYKANMYGHSMGVLSVSTIDPDSSIAVMYRELEKMKAGDFPERDLENAKQVYTTRFFMGEMTNAAKANRLFYNERYLGDWQKAFAYDDINAVSKADVVAAFSKYAHNLQVGVVGDPAKVTEERYIFGDNAGDR